LTGFNQIPALSVKFVSSSLILAACFLIASLVVGLEMPIQMADPFAGLLPLLLMCFLDAAVLSCLIIRSRWGGWKLVAVMFFALFGVKTFLSQIETLVFLHYLVEIVPVEAVPKFFAQGAISAALFSPLAVSIYGRMKLGDVKIGSGERLRMPLTEWVWKLALIAVVYVFVYILFGMFVFKPLAGEAFQEYYSGLQLPWWILPFQAVRGLLWALLALPVIRMLRGRLWESGFAVALMFSVLMASSLLLPTEVMPQPIRTAHFLEILSSNFLFGWITVWLLSLRRRIPYQD